MNNKVIIAIITIVVITGGFIFYSKNQKGVSKEGITCGSTLNPTCYRYRCETGYFDYSRIPPGGGSVDGTGKCSDGSKAIYLGEVK